MSDEHNESPFLDELQDGEAVVSLPTEPAKPEPSQPSAPAPAEAHRLAELSTRYESEVRFLLFRLEKTEKALADFKQRSLWAFLGLLVFGCVSGILVYLAADRAATQITELKPLVAAKNVPFKPSSISFAHWEQGQPPVQLIKSSEGFCVLTKVTGHFQGDGESVKLWIDNDGYWYLGGQSHQTEVGADCAVLRY